MSDLKLRLTPKQIEKLSGAGFSSLYQVVTFLPFKLQQVVPLTASHLDMDAEQLYIWEAKLLRMVRKTGKRSFYQLYLDDGQVELLVYYFAQTALASKILQIGDRYQLLLVYRKGFRTVRRLAKVSPNQSSHFVLGKSDLSHQYIPVYPKQGVLTDGVWQQIHRRLQPRDYVLDLRGLVPTALLGGQILNLYPIHHPKNLGEYDLAKVQWLKFQVFLRSAFRSHLDRLAAADMAELSVLDIDFLREFTAGLPFELTVSQKRAVWDLLVGMSLPISDDL